MLFICMLNFRFVITNLVLLFYKVKNLYVLKVKYYKNIFNLFTAKIPTSPSTTSPNTPLSLSPPKPNAHKVPQFYQWD